MHPPTFNGPISWDFPPGRSGRFAFTTMAKSSVTPADPWQAESDHGTLSRAEEIKGDSKRMKAVKAHHKKTSKALSGLGRSLSGKR